MYRVKNQQLPNSIQGLFQMRESKHDLRGTCVTIKGVNVWNNCSEEMKTCGTPIKFKSLFKNNILNGYGMDL